MISKDLLGSVFYSLFDIIFAYCYDKRITDGEHNTESGWNIGKLSATLSCCEKFDNLNDCLKSVLRRSLCYPLYRHYEFSLKVVEDVKCVFEIGRVAVVKVLLEMMPIMLHSDGRYIFNQLYLEPFAVWVQRVKQKHFKSFAEKIGKALDEVKKSDLDLELEEIENAAQMVIEEEKDEKKVQEVEKLMNKVKIGEEEELDSDDDSDDSSSEESSDDEDDSSSEEENESIIEN